MRVIRILAIAAALIAAPAALAAQGGQGRWNINATPSAASVASASQPAAGPSSDAYVVRLRTLTVTIATGTTAQTPVEIVVRDGASGSGAIIWSGFLSAPANGAATIQQSGLDLRASLGNALTVEFAAAGVTGSQETVSASGDIVAFNYPAFGP